MKNFISVCILQNEVRNVGCIHVDTYPTGDRCYRGMADVANTV
ncbi:hypothetical protein [Nostoc commune]|nr:hypothetical protein [Nostoc commune]